MKRGLLIFVLLALIISPTLIAAAETEPKFNLGSSLNEEIKLPQPIQSIAKIILGIKESPVLTTSLFVILTCIWALIFIVLADVLELTPFFQEWKKWVGAACITLIIAVTGTIEKIGLAIISFGSSITFFESWPTGALLLMVVIILVGAYLINKIFKQIKRYEEKTHAELRGWKRGLLEKREEAADKIRRS